MIIFSAGSMFMASCNEEVRMDGGGWKGEKEVVEGVAERENIRR